MSSCVPADQGRSVSVTNKCSERVEFSMDGGSPPSNPPARDVLDSLDSGTSKTYSVLVGETQPTYIWLRVPASDPVELSPQTKEVVLAGKPCMAQVGGSP